MKTTQMLAIMICASLLTVTVTAEEIPEQTDFQEPAAPILQIDNEHIYSYMNESYAQGYEPLIIGDYAVIVLPLYCEDDDKPDALRVSVGLEPGSPFVVKNYEQTVYLTAQTDSSGVSHEIYLAEFWLAMYADRVNGCYPVSLQVAEFGSYTVYVNIRDGIDPNTAETVPQTEPVQTEEPVILMPKILVQDVSCAELTAGEPAEIHVTLKNTSHTEPLQNLTLTASASEPLSLQSTDTLYFEQIPADAEFEAVFTCKALENAVAGNYTLPLQFDFAYGKGMSGSGSGNVQISVSQPVRMEFPAVVLPAEAVVSDQLILHIQAINLGAAAAQNVRAELSGDGLLPQGTAFLGSVSGGTAAETDLTVQVSSKRGAELYGDTSGQIVFTYEDADGKEYTKTQEFTLTIKSPFSLLTTEKKQASPKYWIYIMAGILCGIVLLFGYLSLRRRKRVSS